MTPSVADHLRMVLRHGEANALTYPKLAALVFGIPAKPDPNDIETLRRQKSAIRQLQEAVPALRAAGAPVCSGSVGLWITDDPHELREQYRALRRRYIHQAIGARALLRTAGQKERERQLALPWAA